MDILLALVAGLCCLGLPTTLLGLPLVLVSVRAVRIRRDRRALIAVGAAFVNALVVGASLAALALVSGIGVDDESAGKALEGFALIGCLGGAPLAFVLTPVTVMLATRTVGASAPPSGAAPPSAPDPAAIQTQTRGNTALGCAIVALVVGVTTSLVGFIASLSIGLISLAFAKIAVRPVAIAFVVVHAVTVIHALRARRVAPGESRTRADLALSVGLVGLVLAVLIAVFGPGFFEHTMERAMDVLFR